MEGQKEERKEGWLVRLQKQVDPVAVFVVAQEAFPVFEVVLEFVFVSVPGRDSSPLNHIVVVTHMGLESDSRISVIPRTPGGEKKSSLHCGK